MIEIHPSMYVYAYSRARLITHLFTDYIGGQSFTKNWIGHYLISHFGQDTALKLIPHGFIVMDTMMNYNTTKKSQVIPETYRTKVRYLISFFIL